MLPAVAFAGRGDGPAGGVVVCKWIGVDRGYKGNRGDIYTNLGETRNQ